MKTKILLVLTVLAFSASSINAQNRSQNFSGVIPSLTMTADHFPRTEAGTGALMPWANRLWLVTYVAHMKGTGSGTGLYEITNDFDQAFLWLEIPVATLPSP